MEKILKILSLFLICFLVASYSSWAADDELEVMKAVQEASVPVKAEPESQEPLLIKAPDKPSYKYEDPILYTLGPDDVVEIMVLRHPEFSGTYPVNLESKIQYKFVGDIDVRGLTKKELEEKITKIISSYVINPEVNVTILEYKSKVIYVLGEVGTPGKFYMKSESIPVREAVVNAGLPTHAAAMRRCRIITPAKKGKVKIKSVDLYTILYGGDLKHNIDMHPGDVLYVPATVMAKVIRVINPVTSAVGVASSGPESVSTGKSAVSTLAK